VQQRPTLAQRIPTEQVQGQQSQNHTPPLLPLETASQQTTATTKIRLKGLSNNGHKTMALRIFASISTGLDGFFFRS
jgi:hypothetical protein